MYSTYPLFSYFQLVKHFQQEQMIIYDPAVMYRLRDIVVFDLKCLNRRPPNERK